MNKIDETILIVDDEKGVRKLLGSILSNIYNKCFEAACVDEALEILKNHAVSVALTDINMPGKSGIDLLNEVRAGYPDIAVIMISAVANSDTAIACMRPGTLWIIHPWEFVSSTEKAKRFMPIVPFWTFMVTPVPQR
jgi:DNA-binding NtrC family response regulator